MTAGIGPLAGIRVLDLAALAPGQFATMLLGDLGADVITIEAPERARAGSTLGELPMYGGVRAREQGINPLHRSRRSIMLDLKRPDGVDIAVRLATGSDVFIEGFRPGACARLGLGYEDLARANPGLVYCSLSGYGQHGELAGRAGHDINYIAEAGLLSATTRPGQRPAIPVNLAADYAGGGLMAAFGILAALTGRRATGHGTHVDVSMYEGLLGLLQSIPTWTAAGAPDPSWGGGLLSGAVPYYDCYRTADDRWLSVGALEPKFFANLCSALGRDDLIGAHGDPARWEELRTTLEEVFGSAPLDHWLDRFAGVDTAIAPVRSLPEAFDLAHQRGVLGAPGVVGPLPRMTGWNTVAGPIASRPGQHTREVLADLGITGDRLEQLLAAGTVAD